MDMVMKLGTEHPVVIFSKTSCGISHTVTTLIRGFGAKLVIHELDELPNGHEIETALMALGCNPSVPAVFIGKQFIGGSNEIMSLYIRGKLKPLLINANAIWI
ncbi:monothiol glutaredoxin-S6-like [Sesamum indicum]|uniref:Monothiol glutaredoxin-S6-like n=1 Tax=Sesamum indicum TaxID=4182 RepID=A0A6I9U252_SESIN|nr:monothiol glutaredoxin-S6-like [Sesamum indicum]